MNPQKLIMTVLAAYESFDSYSDCGKCTPEIPELPSARPFEFQTYFKRPNKFRFRWTSFHPHFGTSKPPKEYVLWTNGAHFKHSFFEEIGDDQSLPMLVAGATGISSSSVNKILNILLPKTLELKLYWQDMTDIASLEDEIVNEVECYHLQGTSKTLNDMDIWVEKRSLIIRRIKEKLVTTEEECREINAYAQSETRLISTIEALQKNGMTADAIEKVVAVMKERQMKPTTTQYTFDYSTVMVNEPIDTALFETL